MKTQEMYICEGCNRTFRTKEECEKHEKDCNIKFPIKIIAINRPVNEETIIRIFTYPNAIKSENMIKFIPSSSYIDYIHINGLFLDKIKYLEDYYAIHTTNFDTKYEKECIQKLIDYKKEVLNEFIEKWKKEIQKHLTEIKNKEYKIETNENFNKMIDEYS